MTLSNHIYRAAHKYNIPADVYTAILMQESSYTLDITNQQCGYISKSAKIKKCIHTDYGIAQIHYKSVERYDFDGHSLLNDLEYSVDAGAKVLSWFYKKYAKREKHWYCRYNVGTGNLARVKTSCEIYVRLVERYL